jgi:hypothetical protein
MEDDMTIQELAQELRARLSAKKRVSADALARVSDNDVVQSSVTCSCCGVKSIDDATLARVIAKSKDAEDFPALTERAQHQLH